MEEQHSDDPFAEENLLGYVDWFELHDRELLEKVLGRLEGVEPVREGEWTWYERSPEGRRVVAELAVERSLLALETYTEKDADYCRSRIEASAGSAIEFSISQASYKPWGPCEP